MNKLDIKTRTQIISCLCEGMGINATCRVTGASKNTVLKLLAGVGSACAKYHDENVRNLKSKRIECDEIWSFVYAKEKNVSRAKSAPKSAGDAWTWTALDADSKLMVSYLVANRNAESALAFTDDVRCRISFENTVQVTTDGLKLYVSAIGESFGDDVDYAQLIKMFGSTPEHMSGKYSPAECTGIRKKVVHGTPNLDKVSTSYVERSNLTIRMQNRRFTRLTNAFSKKIDNHVHAFSLFVMHYNFCKIHNTLRVTPAMEAGVFDHIWDVSELVSLLVEDAPKTRGKYKKRNSN